MCVGGRAGSTTIALCPELQQGDRWLGRWRHREVHKKTGRNLDIYVLYVDRKENRGRGTIHKEIGWQTDTLIDILRDEWIKFVRRISKITKQLFLWF